MDQRVIRSTLEHICLAVQEEGSRPPGLLVVGASCEVIHQPTGQEWEVEDGFKKLDELCLLEDMALIEELGVT